MATTMKIVKYPDPILLRRAEEVTEFGPHLHELVAEMFKSMYAANGTGLAAPQVGISKRLFIVNKARDGKPGDGNEVVCVNPEIVEASGNARVPEGCLSLPGLWGEVDRHTHVTMRAQDADGKTFEVQADGLFAQAIQHELDHLNGTLFITRFTEAERATQSGAIKALEREYEEEQAKLAKAEEARRRKEKRRRQREQKHVEAVAQAAAKKPRVKRH